MELSFWSVIPPVFAIVLAIATRQVIFSLLAGLLVGYSIMAGGNPLLGFLHTIDGLIAVFQSAGSARTVIFTLLIGALIQLIRYAGGVNGFTQFVAKQFQSSKSPKSKLQVGAALMGFLVFIESNISILTVGTVFRPLFDKFGLSREKLAYLADSSSAPSCILIPINAWGAYIMGLLAVYTDINPLSTMLYSIPFNFYPLLTLGLVFFMSSRNKSLGVMKRTVPKPETEHDEETLRGKAADMMLPILIMVLTMPVYLVYTGWKGETAGTFSDKVWHSIGDGSGSQAVLYAVASALLFAGIRFGLSKKINLKTFFAQSTLGMESMMTMAILMALAFAIGNLCNEMQTGAYVASVTESWLSPSLAPAIIFLSSCFIAFSTGTSWGTFAIMMSIAMPLALSIDANIYLIVGAVLGGGIFGDHCSPISDTTLISSVAAGCDHIDHVRTQLPYALITGGISVVLYLIAGIMF